MSTVPPATAGSPPLARNVQQRMGLVLAALLPGAAAKVLLSGVDVAWQLLLAIAVALAFEAVMLKLHGRPIRPFVGDLSALLSAVLLALLLPAQTPWWMLVAGVFVAIVLAKHCYGGLGQNPFNPAMVGYAALLIGFPDNFISVGTNDSWTAGGQAWVAGLYALGGFFLIRKRIIPWQTPIALLVGAATAAVALQFAGVGISSFESHGWPLAGLVLAAFFIVTDPVTGSMSPRGRLLCGLGAGLLTVLLTRVGGATDGLPFAVLTMNIAAPWLDRHTRPIRGPQGARP